MTNVDSQTTADFWDAYMTAAEADNHVPMPAQTAWEKSIGDDEQTIDESRLLSSDRSVRPASRGALRFAARGRSMCRAPRLPNRRRRWGAIRAVRGP